MDNLHSEHGLSGTITPPNGPHDPLSDIPSYTESTENFRLAWRRGALLAGFYLFKQNTKGKFPFVPDLRLVQRAIGPMSPAEKIFLATFTSFCNVRKGGQLLRQRTEFSGFADLGRLDLSRRGVIATLTLHIRSSLRQGATTSSIDPVTALSVEESPWDILIRETRHFETAPPAFLSSWICGVRLAGTRFFGRGPGAELDIVNDKWDLCPKVPLIAKAFNSLSKSEQLFIATLVSFYNAADGGVLLERAGFRGFGDLAKLEHLPRAVIAGLILNYTGW